MVGGGGIVDGFRRLFHRRTPSGSGPSSNQSSAGEESSDIDAVVEDLDLVGLRAIRVPKRKMPLPVESHKKVRQPGNSLLVVFQCSCLLPCLGENASGLLVIIDPSSREIVNQDRIFVATA